MSNDQAKERVRVSDQCEGGQDEMVGGQCVGEERAARSFPFSSPSSLTTHPKKILSIFGTRPEVIKMGPVLLALKESKNFQSLICTTSQHKHMQDSMMKVFGLTADYDLDCMQPGQDLFHITTTILSRLKSVLETVKPDLVLVQGDTTTSFAASLAAFYLGIPVGHVEAGLRTHDLSSPFPEEANRSMIGRLARLHFAPTQMAKKHLLEERISAENIFVTGNTVIDAILLVNNNLNEHKVIKTLPEDIQEIIFKKSPFILITGHRRESFGECFEEMCQAIKALAKKFPQLHFIYPVHLNPNVQKPVNEILGSESNIHLTSPLDYEPFVLLMRKCTLVLSDSGGVQEEAPSLDKPVLVMREKTERMEGVNAGTLKLVGTNKDSIIQNVSELILNKDAYDEMANSVNPYGDGNASIKIVKEIERFFAEC